MINQGCQNQVAGGSLNGTGASVRNEGNENPHVVNKRGVSRLTEGAWRMDIPDTHSAFGRLPGNCIVQALKVFRARKIKTRLRRGRFTNKKANKLGRPQIRSRALVLNN